MPAGQVEIEVKFLIDDLARLRSRLGAMGAVSRGEVLETNYRYDDRTGRLLAAQCLLRLRQDRRARLTFKRPRPDRRAEFKVYDEYEVVVEDFDRMHLILEAIGFSCVQVYEKRREVFPWREALICVDQLPCGNFVEIEGPPEIIRETADRLQFSWERRILANYLHIFEVLRQELNFAFRDLTFENIRRVPVMARHVIRQFEASARP